MNGINIKEAIQPYCKDKLKLVSCDVDEKGNGTYVFRSKKIPEIEVHAIRYDIDSWDEDSNSRILKYFFEKWNNKEKDKFEIEEKYDNNRLLKYDLYIDINDYDEFENAFNLIKNLIQFKNGFNISSDNNIHIRKDNITIEQNKYPQTEEELKYDLEEQYIEKFYNANNIDIPQAIIEKHNYNVK